jgi:dipeptidase E
LTNITKHFILEKGNQGIKINNWRKAMKMYLSSYKLGNKTEKLSEMVPLNNRLGYIANALDFTGADPLRKAKQVAQSMDELQSFGFECFDLDLKKYFGKEDELREYVATLGAVWVCGGNVFVLRQAYRLSGFDTIIHELKNREDFLYGAYSAGVSVLGPTLRGFHLVDDATDTPYDGLDEVIWEGLGILEYSFLPHYDSNHKESEAIQKELEFCEENGLPYKTARDGEVVIVE